MLFNSLEYFVFLAAVLLLYFLLGLQWQNRMLLAASCYFYGSWDWRFLSLILAATCVSYYCNHRIHQTGERQAKKKFLLLSIIINLGVLSAFKYWNFFLDGLVDLLALFGVTANLPVLKILLPVGISF
jgi:alginate O-acetyltransferase complex protein AlgI